MSHVPALPDKRGFLYSFKAWGTPYWQVIHAVTFLYPEENPSDDDKERIRVFIALVPFILPCPLCGMHFIETVEKSPLSDEVLASRDALSRWMVDVHNNTNRRLGKMEVPYELAKQFYMDDSQTVLRPTAPESVESSRASIIPWRWLVIGLVVAMLITIVTLGWKVHCKKNL
jgi:hypothetical protein